MGGRGKGGLVGMDWVGGGEKKLVKKSGGAKKKLGKKNQKIKFLRFFENFVKKSKNSPKNKIFRNF